MQEIMGQNKIEMTLEPASLEPYILFFSSSTVLFKTFFLMHEFAHPWMWYL